MLFIVGLMLLGRTLKQLLKIVTAYSVGVFDSLVVIVMDGWCFAPRALAG